MTQYRHRLPTLDFKPFLTDGGLETTLVFHDRLELPHFAAFDLLKDEAGFGRLARYYDEYAAIAAERDLGFVLETPTWRANADWGKKLGYDAVALADANRRAVSLMLEVRERFETAAAPFVISGNLGPRGDGYRAEARMSIDEARRYHSAQIEVFAETHADLVSALTINYAEEAIGIVRAAEQAAMPVVVSFTTETDGRLPSGEGLAEAIARTEGATGGYAAYYMLNCAHPTHFQHVLQSGGTWTSRLRGLRANASKQSHAELDGSAELDVGHPEELGQEYRALRSLLPGLVVLGGCCGTDARHVRAIAERAVGADGSARSGSPELNPPRNSRRRSPSPRCAWS
jgi:S-methylmethionine-dependent homocysteine/selenocysteine methylase